MLSRFSFLFAILPTGSGLLQAENVGMSIAIVVGYSKIEVCRVGGEQTSVGVQRKSLDLKISLSPEESGCSTPDCARS